MKITFEPSGVCCQQMNLELDDDNIITKAEFIGGCNGNLSGISKLIIGQNALEVADKLSGTTCGPKDTSCPDQLYKAIKKYVK